MIGLYRDLSEQVGLPLVVQDAQGNAPADDLVAAVNEASAIACLKIECPATPHKMGIVREALDDALSGDREVTILGGSNGALLIEELDRGSVRTCPILPSSTPSSGCVSNIWAAIVEPRGTATQATSYLLPGWLRRRA